MTRASRMAVAVVVALVVFTSCNSATTDSGESDLPEEELTGPHLLGVGWTSDELETAEEAIAELQGGRTVRTVTWCDVEPEPGQVSFDELDEEIAVAEERGYEVFLRITVGQCWATTPPPPAPPLPGETTTTTIAPSRDHPDASRMTVDLAAYGSFVSAVVQRYWPTITRFAIEERLNDRDFWDSTFEEYAQLIATAEAAITAARPDARIYDGGVTSDSYGFALADELLRRSAGDPESSTPEEQSPGADPESVPPSTVPPPPTTSAPPGEMPPDTIPGELADEDPTEIRDEETVAAEFYNDYFARRFEEEGTTLESVEDAAELRAVLDTPRAQRGIRFATGLLTLTGIHGHALSYSDPAAFLPDVLDWIKSGSAAGAPESPTGPEISVWGLGVYWPGEDFDEDTAAQDLAKELAVLLGEPVDGIVFSPLLIQVEDLEDPAAASEGEVTTGVRGLFLPTGLPRRMSEVFVTVADLTRLPNLTIETIVAGDTEGVAFGSGGRTRVLLWSREDRPVVLAGEAPADTEAVTISGEEVEWVSPGLPLGPEPVLLTIPGSPDRAVRTIERRLDQAVQDG